MNNIITSQSFYNAISGDYDAILDNISSNQQVRERVAQHFTKNVKGKNIMDFGGGTGADLPWLLEGGFRVFFCEPSEGMQQKAKEWVKNNAKDSLVTFSNEQDVDFSRWTPNRLPVPEPMDGALANFAVLNCIFDIDRLFKSLSLVIKPEGLLLITVIDTRLPQLLFKYPMKVLLRVLLGKKIEVVNDYKGLSHNVYLHSLNEMKQAWTPHFILDDMISLGGYGFLLISLKRI